MIFKNTVLSWFEQKISKKDLTPLYKSILEGRCEDFETVVSRCSERGSAFMIQRILYHGFLMGLLNGLEDYYAFSNRESSLGRYVSV